MHSFLSELNKSLNSAQLQAVNIIRGPLLILAGAGSGKTRVIIHRTLNLLFQNISPSKILLLTFTNKAAKEMKNRLKQLTSSQGIRGMIISTFHSLCTQILYREIHHLAIKSKFSVCHSGDQKQIYFDVYKELKLTPEEMPDEEIRSRISLAKNRLISPEKYPIKENFDKVIKIIYATYQNHLKHYNLLDFDDLLYYTAELFEYFPSVLEKYQSKFEYIMIDEYQDTNYSQYQISKLLSLKHKNLCVVGDDDQSIYSWRGADINNILNFEKDFWQSKVVKLEENYRSTKQILKAANSIIRNNQERKKKELFSIKEKGKKIKIIQGNNSWNEAQKIGEDILLKRLKYNYNYRDFAILYRTNSQSKPIEETFAGLNIPFQTSTKYDFYDRKEIKDALAYVKLIYNSNDDLSLLRIINFPKRGIGLGTIKKLKDQAMNLNLSLFENLKRHLNLRDTPIKVAGEIHDLITCIESYRKKMDSENLGEAFSNFLKDIRFFNAIEQTRGKDKVIEMRLKNVSTLLEEMKNYAQKSKNASLKNYLTKITLLFVGEEKDITENSVHLLTIHSAKGLEFPYVYVIGFEENKLPFLAEDSSMNLTEERRLCYVAMTRAQNELTLSFAKERSKMGKKILSRPSRFLAEIPKSCIDPIHLDNLAVDPSSLTSLVENDIADLTFKRINDLFKDNKTENEISQT